MAMMNHIVSTSRSSLSSRSGRRAAWRALGVAALVAAVPVAHAALPPLPSSSVFAVEIDGVPVPAILAVEGLEHELVVVQPLPEQLRVLYQNPGFVTLTRHFSLDPSFSTWLAEAAKGRLTPRTIKVTLLSQALEVLGSVTFSGCIPVKYSGPTLNAATNAFPTESLKVAWTKVEFARP
jgi:phage tail-like protein